MSLIRIARQQRSLHHNRWRIIVVRTGRPIPVIGSVALRAVRRLAPLAPTPVLTQAMIERRTRERRARMLGFSALGVFLIAIWLTVGGRSFTCVQPNPCLPGGFRGHVAAMEFAQSSENVSLVIGEIGHSNRAIMRREINRDFLFIASYLVLFLLLASVLRARTRDSSGFVAAIATLCAIGTAVFDVIENARILKMIGIPLQAATQEMVTGVLDAALVKWSFSFFTIALLSLTFARVNRLGNVLRGLFLLTSIAGVVGLVSHSLIALSLLPLVIGLLILSVVGILQPRRLIRIIEG